LGIRRFQLWSAQWEPSGIVQTVTASVTPLPRQRVHAFLTRRQ